MCAPVSIMFARFLFCQVRVRDPQAQEKAKQKMAGGDAFHSSSALVATDSSNGGASSSPPGAVLSLQKAYPLTAAKLQLGEFAGFVKEEATGEQDDCYVLLDASRQVILLRREFILFFQSFFS